jgi:SAM-dependent methyltransferase
MSFPKLAELVGSGVDPDLRQVHSRRFAWLAARVRGSAVLELGPADGMTTIPLAERGLAVTAVDPDPDALVHIAARLSVRASAVAGRVSLVESPFVAPPDGTWPTVVVLTAGERSTALQPLLASAARALEPGGRLLLSLRLGMDDRGLPWASASRLKGLRGTGLPLRLQDQELLRTADGSCTVWVSEWVPAPPSNDFVDCFHSVTQQALAHATSGAESLRQVSVRLADRVAATSRELQVLRRGLSTVDRRFEDAERERQDRERALVREREDERRLRLELVSELSKPQHPSGLAAAAATPIPADGRGVGSTRGSGLRVVAAASGLNSWVSSWVVPVAVSEAHQAPDQVDVLLVDSSLQTGTAEQRELVGLLRTSGVRVVDVRRAPSRPVWQAAADVVVDLCGQPASSGALAFTEPVDIRRVNPRGFTHASHDVVGAVATTEVVPGTLQRLAARLPGARDVVLRRVQRLDEIPREFRSWRAVIDHADLHSGSVTHASTLVRLAAAGVPVVAFDLPLAVRDLLGAELTAALEAVPLNILVDEDDRERASIVLRRTAMGAHSSEARWRSLAAALDLRVPRQPALSMLLATNRPDYLQHALTQASRQDHPNCELVVALHGDGFSADAERRIADGYAGESQVLRISEAETLGDALNAAADAASGELLTKFDDDDWYGPEHLSDLVLAQGYSGATLVAKGAEFVYLSELDITLRRFTTGAETASRTVAGGTILISKHDLSAVSGWRRARRSVDQLLVDDVLAAGGEAYRTHGHGYVLNRHGQGHTWNPALDYFLEQSTRQWRGFAAAAASVL